MKKIWKTLFAIAISAFIFFLQVLGKEFLPYPFNQINVIFAAMVWLLILTAKVETLWYGAPLALLIEVFGSSEFGLNSVLLLFTFILIFWLLTNFFTNRSFFIVLLLGVIGMTFYRTLFIVFNLVFTDTFNDVGWSGIEILTTYGLETAITAITLTLFYLLTSLFLRKLNPSYISISKI